MSISVAIACERYPVASGAEREFAGGQLSSTGYALVEPGREYLVLQPPRHADQFTVRLDAGTYAPEWHDLETRETRGADQVLLLGYA